jgi:hypothetical protein
MGLKFKALRLPFVRISDGKSGRTVTWRVGAWSYNSRTGKQSIKLGKNARWESKTGAQKAKEGRYTAKQVEQQATQARRKSEQQAKAKAARTAQRKAERQEWQRKIAAGQVDGLRVPADVRAPGSASHAGPGAKPRKARPSGQSRSARSGPAGAPAGAPASGSTAGPGNGSNRRTANEANSGSTSGSGSSGPRPGARPGPKVSSADGNRVVGAQVGSQAPQDPPPGGVFNYVGGNARVGAQIGRIGSSAGGPVVNVTEGNAQTGLQIGSVTGSRVTLGRNIIVDAGGPVGPVGPQEPDAAEDGDDSDGWDEEREEWPGADRPPTVHNVRTGDGGNVTQFGDLHNKIVTVQDGSVSVVGRCGARTKDGSPCRNPAGGCPHHRGRGGSGTNPASH